MYETLHYGSEVFNSHKPILSFWIIGYIISFQLENTEVEKSNAFIIVEILEYIPNSVVIKTIIRKTTGNVTAVSFD